MTQVFGSEGPGVREIGPMAPEARAGSPGAWEIVCSAALWTVSGLFFFGLVPGLILLGALIDPRKNDRPQRWMSRMTVKLAGARIEVRRSSGFNPNKACFLVSNHVNLFDPFVLYSSIPQFFRGLELESHFRIPVYGWLMKRFGNVPVPDISTPSNLKRMWRMTQDALCRGVSLVVFPEGSRTVTGRVGPFHDGAFRMALRFGAPITPVSMVGSFEFNRKTSWMLRPATIIVYLHDTIETAHLDKRDVAGLRDRVRAIVAAPVEAHFEGLARVRETEKA
jgi:1-acyl-sn-glycerol-3-phosphate acyltransferase